VAYELEAIIVATSGIVLWIVTQFHLLRVARRIEFNIESKREETQKFVDSRLGKVEEAIGGFEARIRSEIPPNTDGRLKEIDDGIQAALATLDVKLAELPERFRMEINAMRSVDSREMKKLANEMAAVYGETALEENPELRDPKNALMQRILASKLPAGYEEQNPLGALLWQAARAQIVSQVNGTTPGISVRRSGSEKSPYGL